MNLKIERINYVNVKYQQNECSFKNEPYRKKRT